MYQSNAVYFVPHGEVPANMLFELSGNGAPEIVKIRFNETISMMFDRLTYQRKTTS